MKTIAAQVFVDLIRFTFESGSSNNIFLLFSRLNHSAFHKNKFLAKLKKKSK